MNQLIRCKICDDVFMKSPYDQSPAYEWNPGSSTERFKSIEKDDYQDFLVHHHGHQLENLKIIEDSFVSEKAYSEPMKTGFFKATNGTEYFVIKKFRENIDEPLKYRLIHGDFALRCASVEIQPDEISKQLKRGITPPLSQDKIDSFIKLYRHIVEEIDIKDLERIAEESLYPLEVYYKLDDVHVMYLLRNCHNIFKGQEFSAIQEFIQQQKEDGVLLIKATYKIQLMEARKSFKKEVPASLSLKKAKVIRKK